MSCTEVPDQPTRRPGLKRCQCGLVKQATCDFCGYSLQFAGLRWTVETLGAWKYFALDREQRPERFPIEYHEIKREQCEWLCCPECLAESGGPGRISAYLDEPRAMHPAPSYVRVYRYGDKPGERITIEERTT